MHVKGNPATLWCSHNSHRTCTCVLRVSIFLLILRFFSPIFRLVIDFVCLLTYEFCLSLWKISRCSVILLLPLFGMFWQCLCVCVVFFFFILLSSTHYPQQDGMIIGFLHCGLRKPVLITDRNIGNHLCHCVIHKNS